jgi:hypothetical protein
MIIRQDPRSWYRGHDDAIAGRPSKCPKGIDRLAYASGRVEGEADRRAALCVVAIPELQERACAE